MKYHTACEPPLAALDHSVASAVAFFRQIDEELSDGHETAREVLSHLVYWHNANVGIAWALVTHRVPPFFTGRYIDLNAKATDALRSESIDALCHMFAHRQRQLVRALRRLPDWGIEFPVKDGCLTVSAARHLHDTDAHIRGHIMRLKRATLDQVQVIE